MLAESIRRARRSEGLSQRDLAKAAAVPQSTVARIEAGALRPRTDTVQKILEALDHEVVLRRRLGRGVDRTLIRRMLSLSPRQRIQYAVSAGEAIARLRQGARAPE
jgi:predicted transcriptional regulator